MKIIAINGSPRHEKTTHFALQTVFAQINESKPDIDCQIVNLSGKTVNPCISCDGCRKSLVCSAHNDYFNELIPLLSDESVKCFIFASPVYMGSVTSQMKAFIDRTVMFRRNGFMFKNKIGAAITVGGSRNGGQELAIQTIHAAYLIHDMIVIGDGNPTAHFGGIGWERFPGGIENDPDSLNTFKGLGKRIAETLELCCK